VCRNARGGRQQGQGTIGHLVRHNTAVSLSALHIIDLMSFCVFFFHMKMEMDTGGIFSSGLVFLITRFMEHFMRPTPIYPVQNSGRDPRTLQMSRRPETL
jgi:hypothetical protein